MSFAAGVEAGLLLGKKFGGGNAGKLRGLSGDVIIIYDTSDDKGDPVQSEKYYTLNTFIFTKNITIKKTQGDTTTTFSESFSKIIITGIQDGSGNKILTADYDENTGTINGYCDADGKEIKIL